MKLNDTTAQMMAFLLAYWFPKREADQVAKMRAASQWLRERSRGKMSLFQAVTSNPDFPKVDPDAMSSVPYDAALSVARKTVEGLWRTDLSADRLPSDEGYPDDEDEISGSGDYFPVKVDPVDCEPDEDEDLIPEEMIVIQASPLPPAKKGKKNGKS